MAAVGTKIVVRDILCATESCILGNNVLWWCTGGRFFCTNPTDPCLSSAAVLLLGLAVDQDVDDQKPSQVFPVAAGIAGIDQVLNVLLTTAMFVGGCVAFILDNTIPGEP